MSYFILFFLCLIIVIKTEKSDLKSNLEMDCSKQNNLSDKNQSQSAHQPFLTSNSIGTGENYVASHRKEVLRLVSNLSAAMFAKQSEQGLLRYIFFNLIIVII